MGFLNGIFLFFFPVVMIPLLIAIMLSINKKKALFPSIIFLQEIIQKELLNKRIMVRLKNILRALILLMIILAFAGPVTGSSFQKKEFIAVIDNTISMGRFPIDKILAFLYENYTIKKVYLGNKIYSENKTLYTPDADQLSDMILNISLKEKPDNLIIVSDGQECNLKTKFKNLPGLKYVVFIQIIDTNAINNCYVKNVETFPQIAIPGEKIDFSVELGGMFDKNTRIGVYINENLIFSDKADSKILFTRFIDGKTIKSGLNKGEIRITGDNFTYDNTNYFVLFTSSKPSIYNNIESPVIDRIINSVYPSYFITKNFEIADVIITSYLPKKVENKAVFLFCEDVKKIENLFRRDFTIFPEFVSREVKGNINSSNSLFTIVRNMNINTLYTINDNLSYISVKASVNSIPILYQIKNYALFPFSLKENEEYFENSPSLLILISGLLTEYNQDRYFLKSYIKDQDIFYDMKGNFIKDELPAGIYKEKNSGKIMLKNVNEESILKFLSENSIKKSLKDLYPENTLFFTLDNSFKINNTYLSSFITSTILILITLCLFFFEALL